MSPATIDLVVAAAPWLVLVLLATALFVVLACTMVDVEPLEDLDDEPVPDHTPGGRP